MRNGCVSAAFSELFSVVTAPGKKIFLRRVRPEETGSAPAQKGPAPASCA